jgi:hypothetical protein
MMLCLRRALETIRLFVGGPLDLVVLWAFLVDLARSFQVRFAEDRGASLKTVLELDYQLQARHAVRVELGHQISNKCGHFVRSLTFDPRLFFVCHFASLAVSSSKRHSPFFPELAGGKA